MTRKEIDSIGQLTLNDTQWYGIHTKRAKDNFNLAGRDVNLSLIYAIVEIKKAAAQTNGQLGLLDKEKAEAIVHACDEILEKKWDAQFTTDALQGGAGTSTNMNVNEVVANVGLKYLGHELGEYTYLDPFDDVNHGQSTNDVYPSALRIAAIRWVRMVSDELARLQQALQQKEAEFEGISKLGRTQLMDAVPVTLGEEFGAYAQAIGRDRWRIYKVEERLRMISLGGTAVGTGVNAMKRYSFKVVDQLRDNTGIGLARAEFPMDLTQNNDVFVEVSGLLKSCAVNLMKIANDLRLMNSGPKGGLGEIGLRAWQAGSSIMPGKVNPVIPEMVVQGAMKVMANDVAITQAASYGQLELNAFMPLIADSLLDSLMILKKGVNAFTEKCINSVEANIEQCSAHLQQGAIWETALVPLIGYHEATKIYKEAGSDLQKLEQILHERTKLSDEQIIQIIQSSNKE